ncbi:MAG: 2-phosphosulfolactate phosphatase [Acidimicrobiales bacterium]
MVDTSQSGFAYRFDWGPSGLQALGPGCAVILVVDVLRFTTAVTVAVERGACVYPYPWEDGQAAAYASARGAELAGLREDGGWSLSPTDLQQLPPGTGLVLPSPNGSTIAYEASRLGVAHVVAACLRNATAAARVASLLADGDPIGVIAAGERGLDGTLRPAVEDLLGAGAVLAALDPSGAISAPGCSPEADAARAAFVAARPRLPEGLAASASGRQLVGRGWADDVAMAAAHDTSWAVPLLVGDAFVAPQGAASSALN